MYLWEFRQDLWRYYETRHYSYINAQFRICVQWSVHAMRDDKSIYPKRIKWQNAQDAREVLGLWLLVHTDLCVAQNSLS